MDRVGISFQSTQTTDEVRHQFIGPLRTALETAHAGVYSNYLHQDAEHPGQATEHLLVFEVNDFRDALRLLRTQLEKLNPPKLVDFHNLNPSDLPY